MGGKVPQPVRLEVIREWLLGYPRDKIAKDVGIGAATVSGIIQQCRHDDADFDLLRGVAVELRARGLRVEDFAPLLRLKSILEEKEVALDISKNANPFTEYKKFEALIITLEALCFKREMSLDQFSISTLKLLILVFQWKGYRNISKIRRKRSFGCNLKQEVKWKNREQR